MKKNLGNIDMTIRLIGGLVLSLLAIPAIESALWSAIVGAVGIFWFVTGLASNYPEFVPLEMSARRSEDDQ